MSTVAGSVVIVGAGLAGAHTAATLRRHGFTGSVTMLGDEGLPPYERPGLSKSYLQGNADADSLSVQPMAWYAQNSVDIRLADPVTAIERAAQQVRLGSGVALDYDHLVLATGARPRLLDLPGSDLLGVQTLRTLADSTRLRAGLLRDRAIAIVGGGWIGLEVAAAAALAGCQVTVLERDALPLRAVLGDRMAHHLAGLHLQHGVDLRCNTGVLGFESHDAVTVSRVVTSAGLVPADIVLVGVGAIPNTELAAAAGLSVANGIVVDEHLRTSDRAILAAGDVARAHNVTLGEELRVEHWDNAIRQGRLAARSILGRPDVYDWQPYFFTDQYDFGMEYVGHGRADDEVVVRGDPASGEFIAFWLRDGRISAAMNVNIWDVNDALRDVIGAEISPSRLLDVGVPLTDLRELKGRQERGVA